MARVVVTGGTGFVGRFIAADLAGHGHEVAVAARTPPQPEQLPTGTQFRPMQLDPDTDYTDLLAGMDVLVHGAFAHVPGRYRGGEGDDPAGFVRANQDGTYALFRAARDRGLSRILFLSSRAVYGAQPPGADLFETTPPHPDTLYGEVKQAGEQALAELSGPGLSSASLRITGVYGTADRHGRHKWRALFRAYLAGEPVAPRVASEIHGEDVGAAVRRLLTGPEGEGAGEVYNVSDLVIDRRDLLAPLKRYTDCPHPLPDLGERASLNVMDTAKLESLGWRPSGRARLDATLEKLVRTPL